MANVFRSCAGLAAAEYAYDEDRLIAACARARRVL
jgi:hypothetical protein